MLNKAGVGATIVILMLVAACGTGTSSPATKGATKGDAGKNLKTVTYVLTSPEADAHTAYYSSVPNYLGYWKQEGLDVKIQLTGDSTTGATSVSSGKALTANIGVSATAVVLSKASNLRIVSFDATENFYATVVPAGSNIKSYKDLEGKMVGVQSLGSASYFVNRAAVAASGGNPEAVKWVPVGIGPAAAQALKSKRIVAYAGYDGPIAGLENMGLALDTLPSPLRDSLKGFNGYDATVDTIRNNPDEIVGFVRAINKAIVFCKTNLEACVKIHYKVFPETKPVGVSEESAIKQGVNLLKSRLDNVKKSPEGNWGDVPAEKFNAVLDFYTKNGIVKSRQDQSTLVDRSLIKQMNAFDEQAIITDAKNFQLK